MKAAPFQALADFCMRYFSTLRLLTGLLLAGCSAAPDFTPKPKLIANYCSQNI